MKLPWWHDQQNPNGFYPEPKPVPTKVHWCKCTCGADLFTFGAFATLEFIAAHQLCPEGSMAVTPADDMYEALVENMWQEALYTVGPRT